MPKVVYIAGAIGAPTKVGVERNRAKAVKRAVSVWKLGAAAICPHAMPPADTVGISYEQVISIDRELVRRCDALLLVPGWQNSPGAKREIEEATGCSIPVFRTLKELKQWLTT